MRLDVIFRVATKVIIPFLLVFALYVHFHGDFSPGGGFQAGVMLAGAVILYAIIFGVRAAQRVVPQWIVAPLVPLGVLIYSVTGAFSFIYGMNYMDYAALAHDSKHGHHFGILLVEVGVIVTVASTMTAIFYAFIERGR